MEILLALLKSSLSGCNKVTLEQAISMCNANESCWFTDLLTIKVLFT